MSLIELETLHQLCELECTQMLQSHALAVLKILYTGYLLSGNRSSFIDYEGNLLWYYVCTKNYHLCMFLKIKDAIKNPNILQKQSTFWLIHSPAELIFGIQQCHVDQKTATM